MAMGLISCKSHLKGYSDGMTNTIDNAGRIVIPKALRDRAGRRHDHRETWPIFRRGRAAGKANGRA